MSVLQTDIKFHGSGANNLGGTINPTEIATGALHTLFDAVRAAEALTGMTDYRCIYVQNANTTSDTLEAPIIWIQAQPANPGVSVEIGVGAAAFNNPEATLPGGNENTAPAGVVFTAPADATNGLKFMMADQAGPTGEGQLAPNDYKAIWIKRVVAPATAAMASDQFTLTVLGETT
jgi:hypothetical protein